MKTKDEKPHINVDYFEDLTGQIDAPAAEGLEEIGNRVRQLRESKGLTLKDLSKLTGFDEALLDRIEQATTYEVPEPGRLSDVFAGVVEGDE